MQPDGLAHGGLTAVSDPRRVLAVRVQSTGEALASLLDLLGQRALQDAQPVAVRQHLVLRVHHGDRILQVHDGRQRRLHDHVADAGRVVLADRRAAVDPDVEVDPVVEAPEDCRRQNRQQ